MGCPVGWNLNLMMNQMKTVIQQRNLHENPHEVVYFGCDISQVRGGRCIGWSIPNSIASRECPSCPPAVPPPPLPLAPPPPPPKDVPGYRLNFTRVFFKTAIKVRFVRAKSVTVMEQEKCCNCTYPLTLGQAAVHSLLQRAKVATCTTLYL
jgi:hypothetical protein